MRLQDAPRFAKLRMQMWEQITKNYLLFMIPNRYFERLFSNMQSNMNSSYKNWQTWLRPYDGAALGMYAKESQLKLSLETRNRGDVMIVHCQGRIVYRDEAAALSQLVGELLNGSGRVVIDLTGVSAIDSAGIGELAFLQSLAQSRNADLKCASPTPFVRDLLDLTNLNSVLEIHANVGDALAAFQPDALCADC